MAIIGASASGLLTARLLAERGRQVDVLERAKALAPSRRALITTSTLLEYLGPHSRRSIVNEINRFELFTDGRVANIHLDSPDLVIDRSVLIQELAAEAKASGARLLLDRRVTNLKDGPDGLSVRVTTKASEEPEEMPVGTVVGGDGAFSVVARAAGWPKQPTVPLLQAVVQLSSDMSPDATRVWFRPQDTPYFFWLIPEGPDRGVLGLIGLQAGTIRTRLDSFLEEKNLEPLEYQAAQIPRYARWTPAHRRLRGGDVYLVGDAAGHVKVSTVGGLVTGFKGAVAVAEAISGGNPRRRFASLRRELDSHLLIRRTLHGFRQDDYSRLLDLLNDSVKRTLGKHSRDEAWRLARVVLRAQPRLALLAAKALMNRSESATS